MKNILIGVFSVLFVSITFAQNESKLNTVDKIKPVQSVSKFYSSVTVGFMPGQELSKSFHIINGYKFNSHLQAGIGLGVEDIAHNGYSPLFLHGQYNLFKKSTSPFISVMVGYEMALSDQEQNKGGFTTGAQFGVNHYFSEHIGLTTSVGYRYGYFKQEYNSGWWGGGETITTIREINRFEFRFGLVFK